MTKTKIIAQIILVAALWSSNSLAATSSEIKSLREEFNNIRNSYEKRISSLEISKNSSKSSSKSTRNIYSNKFNPSMGVILNGQYTNFSKKDSEISGFAVGEEGERGNERFSIGESELNFSSNIDDKFYGSMTAAIVNEDGSKIELEEAFIRTSPGFGLPTGLEIKAGRAFWNLGYLNSHHAHTDDFSDRPLTHRAFLNKSFNDDGAQLSYVLPTDIYLEIGGGSFRGDDFPFGGGDGVGSYSAYGKIGDDIGENQNWQFGGSVLSGEVKAGRETAEGDLTFAGDTELYIADLRYNFTPTGNAKNQELTLQGEYFYREEDGVNPSLINNINDNSSGFYIQSVYKFKPQWRFGVRYSKLYTPNNSVFTINALNSEGYNPKSYSTMLDWTNSEFSRIRLQYNHEELSRNNHDNQFVLQYVMSFGAHGAHKY